MSAAPPPGLDALATPLAWTQADGTVAGSNPAFARRRGAGARQEQVWLRRLPLAFPGAAPRFADVWVGALEGGGWLLEAHPVDEFPGEDPVAALPSALSAALRGLAHELRNPLAGLKGAAQ